MALPRITTDTSTGLQPASAILTSFAAGTGQTIPSGNYNSATTLGFYNGIGAGAGSNYPPGYGRYGMVLVLKNGGYITQMTGFDYSGSANEIYIRGSNDFGATWSAWAMFMTQTSMIDAVSQSSGVPTGGIIENGNNANGEYTKFADGTLICTKTLTSSVSITTLGSLFVSSAFAGGAFASAFSAVPYFVGADCLFSSGNNYPIKAVDHTLTTFGTWRIGASASAASSTFTMRWVAIGRWF